MMEEISNLISQYGFPIIAAIGAGYMVYYVWRWTTEVVDPILNEAKTTLIALIDRVRMLDNDLIRLNQKLNVILQLREQELEEQRKKDLKKDKKD
jgi:hypothetical protein